MDEGLVSAIVLMIVLIGVIFYAMRANRKVQVYNYLGLTRDVAHGFLKSKQGRSALKKEVRRRFLRKRGNLHTLYAELMNGFLNEKLLDEESYYALIEHAEDEIRDLEALPDLFEALRDRAKNTPHLAETLERFSHQLRVYHYYLDISTVENLH